MLRQNQFWRHSFNSQTVALNDSLLLHDLENIAWQIALPTSVQKNAKSQQHCIVNFVGAYKLQGMEGGDVRGGEGEGALEIW